MRELSQVKGVGPKTLEKLNALNIFTVGDLADFLPLNYVDLDAVSDLENAVDGEFVLLKLIVSKANKPFRKGSLSMFAAYGLTESGKKIKLSFYNSPYAAKIFTENKIVRCFGKLRLQKGAELINPAYEVCEGESKFTGIKPIYPTRGHVPQATFISIAGDALSDYRADSFIPDDYCIRQGLLSLTEAYRAAHKPQAMSDIHSSRERIILDNLVKRICAFRLIREFGKRTEIYEEDISILNEFIKSFPYSLTPSQDKAVKEIVSVLRSDKPLNAMLVGDVGSGKTAVAVIAAYFAVKCGKQVAVMAPTEILALQHFKTFSSLLTSFGVKTALLTGSMTTAEKNAVKRAVVSGEVDIIIGTHAVISKGVKFKNLAFAVIDEQHRFGVAQRTALIDKGESVDVLTLSATPIPRSLRLTMFGDIDVINIERRFESDNIITALVPKIKRAEMLSYVVGECEKGKQAYIVCPRIVDDEGIDSGSVEAIYKELVKKYGKTVEFALLHGKLSAADKAKILSDFAENKVQILVSTTVIEVGIDVPNASLMIVFGAERFGLATLHQLRGRIGRNGARAYCFLYSEKDEENVRLTTLVKERDGLAIAEEDYEIRGAGEWLGESQSGGGDFFRPTVKLIVTAKSIADGIDVSARKDELIEYATRLSLSKVTLN